MLYHIYFVVYMYIIRAENVKTILYNKILSIFFLCLLCVVYIPLCASAFQDIKSDKMHQPELFLLLLFLCSLYYTLWQIENWKVKETYFQYFFLCSIGSIDLIKLKAQNKGKCVIEKKQMDVRHRQCYKISNIFCD